MEDKQNIVNKIKSTPRYIWILLGIILIGIFLRTYHFRDWLVFNPDQARDAMIIQGALVDSSKIPLLGPEAGNTRFSLGPIFYYFEFVSAKIFGNNPEAMAYPDLIFSIGTILLFFYFAKKYFSRNISLSLAAILSISFFAVRYSRFAMNTNSIPFFTLLFLFGLLEMLDPKNKKAILGPMLAGIALGVGVQLHALLLIVMPLTALIVLGILIKRKIFAWRSLAIVILAVLILNAGQILYDIQNSGLNSHLFISSVGKSSGKNTIFRNLGMDAAYQIQANAHMISSLGDQNDARFIKIFNRILKDKNPYATAGSKVAPLLGMALSLIFSAGGYFFLGYFFRREKDPKRKNFLLLISLYAGLMFFIMLPIIQEASLRYFIIILFLPFIFLGLWMQFMLERDWKKGTVFSIVAAIFLLIANLATIKAAAAQYQAKATNSVDNATLGEIEPMLGYMLDESNSSPKIYLAGKNLYLIRFYKPLAYLAGKEGVEIVRIYSDREITPGIPLFYIKDSQEKNTNPGEIYKSHTIKNVKIFNKIMIFNFVN